MTVAAEKDLVAIGVLAAHLRVPVRRIELLAEVLRLEPALRLSGIVYFDARQTELICQSLPPRLATFPADQRRNIQ